MAKKSEKKAAAKSAAPKSETSNLSNPPEAKPPAPAAAPPAPGAEKKPNFHPDAVLEGKGSAPRGMSCPFCGKDSMPARTTPSVQYRKCRAKGCSKPFKVVSSDTGWYISAG